MTVYIVAGLIALVILYKIFEERGSSWAYIFCLLLFAALEFYSGKFVIMYNQGIIQFLIEMFLILIITFIYNKFMYLLYNCFSIVVLFVISSTAMSYLFYLGVVKIYPIILNYVLDWVYKLL